MKRLSRPLTALILLQLLIIINLTIYIYDKEQSLRNFSVNSVLGENIVHPPNSNYKWFYELSIPKAPLATPPSSSNPTYYINSAGLHDRFNYEETKSSNTFRIITLGDSWTFGLHVDTSENYSEVLEDMLNNKGCNNPGKFEVINLGVYGYDIEFAIERFRLKGAKYDADLVIFLVLDSNLLISAEDRLQESYKHKKALESRYGRALSDSEFIEVQLEVIKKLEKNQKSQTLKKQVGALSKLNDYVDGNLLITTYGIAQESKEAIDNLLRQKEDFLIYHQSALNKNELIPGDGHPNQEGHRELASRLFEYIKEKDLISCP